MTGPCPCHPTMDDAITGHTALVHNIARRLNVHPGHADWDDAISDGMLALWQALTSYDPTRRDIDRYLALRVRHRIIDGLRVRSGRGHDRPTFLPLEAAHDIPAEQPDATEHAEADDLIHRLATVDPRLPAIAALIAAGYTRTETGALHGLSRTRIWQLLTLAARHRAA